MALEAARILHHMGCDVRVFAPTGLPMKDGVSEKDAKVAELRELSEWSRAQFWCSPEQHGTITAVMKNQSGSLILSLTGFGYRILYTEFFQSTGSPYPLVLFGPRKVGHWLCAR